MESEKHKQLGLVDIGIPINVHKKTTFLCMFPLALLKKKSNIRSQQSSLKERYKLQGREGGTSISLMLLPHGVCSHSNTSKRGQKQPQSVSALVCFNFNLKI